MDKENIKPFNSLKKFSFATFLKIFGIVIITILFWEHLGRKYETTIRPSIGLQFVSKISSQFFDWVGRKIAWISSYLTQIDLKDFMDTCRAIGEPTLEILASPFHIIIGYIVAANTYTNGILVYVGTGIIIMLILIVCYKYDYFQYLQPLIKLLCSGLIVNTVGVILLILTINFILCFDK